MALIVITTDSGEEIGRTRIVPDQLTGWGAQLTNDMSYIIGLIQTALEIENRESRLFGNL